MTIVRSEKRKPPPRRNEHADHASDQQAAQDVWEASTRENEEGMYSTLE